MKQTDPANIHQPVMPSECIQLLDAANGGLFVDATVGLGGHTELILMASPNATVVGIDQDPAALAAAKKRLRPFGSRFRAVRANFSDIKQVVESAGSGRPRGILADLGVSSLQLDTVERGFSLRFDAPLDMRMDQTAGESAADMLATIDQNELADIIYLYGEERASRKIARWIIEKREKGEPVTTTRQLAELVRRAVKTSPKEKTHPATRTFQALRIAVNRELDILPRFVDDSIEVLSADGVLAVITFHSLEDRIIKRQFQLLSGKCQCPPRIPQCKCGAEKKVEILTRKPMVASVEEQNSNSRSRSAKLRACRKLAE